MADAPITTGASSLGASGLKDLLTFVSDMFIQAKRNRVRVLNMINTQASADLATRGQTVNVHLAPTITSRLLTDGNAKVLDDDVGTNVACTLNKHRYSAFSLTQIAQAMKSGPGVLTMELEARIAGILNDVEEDIIQGVAPSFTTNVLNAYNTALDEDDIIACRTALMTGKAPEDSPWVGILRHNTNAYAAVSKLTGFAQAHTRSSSAASPNIETGPTFGQGVPWHNILWFVSQTPKITGGTDIDNVVFHRDAICAAFRPMQQPMSPGVQAINIARDGIALQILLQWDGSKLADEMVVHLLYGYTVGREDWGVLLKS